MFPFHRRPGTTLQLPAAKAFTPSPFTMMANLAPGVTVSTRLRPPRLDPWSLLVAAQHPPLPPLVKANTVVAHRLPRPAWVAALRWVLLRIPIPIRTRTRIHRHRWMERLARNSNERLFSSWRQPRNTGSPKLEVPLLHLFRTLSIWVLPLRRARLLLMRLVRF